jgi:hypothetical protein
MSDTSRFAFHKIESLLCNGPENKKTATFPITVPEKKIDLVTHTIKEPTFVDKILRVFLNSCIPNYRKTAKYNGCMLCISVNLVHGQKRLNLVESINTNIDKPRNVVPHE